MQRVQQIDDNVTFGQLCAQIILASLAAALHRYDLFSLYNVMTTLLILIIMIDG